MSLLAKSFFHLPLPLPFRSRTATSPPLRVFLTKFKSNCTHPNFDANLARPSCHFRFRSFSGHRAPFNSMKKKFASTVLLVNMFMPSGLGRKPEWVSNALISLNSELPLSSANHDWATKVSSASPQAQAASQPFSVCRSYMNMITLTPPHINCAVPSSEAATASPGFFFFRCDDDSFRSSHLTP